MAGFVCARNSLMRKSVMDISIRLEMIEESLRKLLVVAGGMTIEKWFKVEEVSEILGLGETKVRELMSSGRLRSCMSIPHVAFQKRRCVSFKRRLNAPLNWGPDVLFIWMRMPRMVSLFVTRTEIPDVATWKR